MKIVVNGREYSSRNELPPEARESYDQAMATLVDKNGNGIPDILEMHMGGDQGLSAWSRPGETPVSIVTSQQIVIDGQHFDSLDQVPPDKRQMFEHLRSKLSAWGAGQSPGSGNELDMRSDRYVTFSMEYPTGHSASWSLTPLVLVVGGIIIGLAIALFVLFFFGGLLR